MYKSRLWKAEIRTSLISDHGIDHFSEDGERGLGNAVREHPHERPKGGLHRIFGEIELAEVGVVRVGEELDGGRVVEDRVKSRKAFHDSVEY